MIFLHKFNLIKQFFMAFLAEFLTSCANTDWSSCSPTCPRVGELSWLANYAASCFGWGGESVIGEDVYTALPAGDPDEPAIQLIDPYALNPQEHPWADAWIETLAYYLGEFARSYKVAGSSSASDAALEAQAFRDLRTAISDQDQNMQLGLLLYAQRKFKELDAALRGRGGDPLRPITALTETGTALKKIEATAYKRYAAGELRDRLKELGTTLSSYRSFRHSKRDPTGGCVVVSLEKISTLIVTGAYEAERHRPTGKKLLELICFSLLAVHLLEQLNSTETLGNFLTNRAHGRRWLKLVEVINSALSRLSEAERLFLEAAPIVQLVANVDTEGALSRALIKRIDESWRYRAGIATACLGVFSIAAVLGGLYAWIRTHPSTQLTPAIPPINVRYSLNILPLGTEGSLQCYPPYGYPPDIGGEQAYYYKLVGDWQSDGVSPGAIIGQTYNQLPYGCDGHGMGGQLCERNATTTSGNFTALFSFPVYVGVNVTGEMYGHTPGPPYINILPSPRFSVPLPPPEEKSSSEEASYRTPPSTATTFLRGTHRTKTALPTFEKS